MSKEFKAAIEEALENKVLESALGRFAESYTTSWQEVYNDINFENLREEISKAKAYAADHLDEVITKFKEEAERRGAKVFFAADATAANQYILDLAQQKGIKEIIKSKSMATEEIELNSFLEKNGLTITESDLGEWILQLMKEKPSHMVMPAIHLTRHQIAEVLSSHLKEEVPPDPETMVRIVRRQMRQKFLSAGMGITGANIAVAETGTLVIVTNEGNARLTTTLPPVQVAVVGLEKIVPKMDDALNILTALPRSATAQHITSYITMISGAVAAFVAGHETLKDFHIVLLDNGRTKLAQDPIFKAAWQCIRCASCLNVCPVYERLGGHVYGGKTYAGAIGTILTAFFSSLDDAAEIQNLCLSCGRCAEFCPGKVPLADLILELRKRIVEKEGLGFIANLALKYFLANPKLMQSALSLASKVEGPLTKGEPFIRSLPDGLNQFVEKRSFPAIAKKQFRQIAPQLEKTKENPKAKLSFYAGCVVDFMYPDLGEAVFKILDEENYEINFPQQQACCGAPAFYMGDMETTLKLAKINLEALDNENTNYIITVCPTCALALKEIFPKITEGDAALHQKALRVSSKVRDFTQFVAEEEIEFKEAPEKKIKVTYHDSCHFNRHLHLSSKARQVLKQHPAVEFVEMEGADKCCGFGGSYTAKFPQISAALLEKKLKFIEESGAEVVAVDCPGCLLQLQGGLDKKGSKIKVMHTASLLKNIESEK